jgi:hypothetical protein
MEKGGYIVDDADVFGYVLDGQEPVIVFSKANPFELTPATITVDLGDGVIRERPTAGLEKRVTKVDNAVECTHAVEYWLGDKLVHRSADVKLKQPSVLAEGIAASIG